MTTLADIRAKEPALEGLDDEHAVNYLHKVYYPTRDRGELASRLGIKPQAEQKAAPSRNAFAVANDFVIEAANAAAGGVGSAAEFVSPGNRFSRFIREGIIAPGEASQSDVTKASRQQFQEEMQAADGLGDEVSAVGRKVLRDPLLTAAQAAGSFVVPGGAVKAAGGAARFAGAGVQGVTRAGLAGGAVAGGSMAGGDAAGTAYELVTNAGGSEEQAVDAARRASIVPAAIGAAGGVVGAEKLLAGGKGFGGGMVARAVKTGAAEGAQEAVEEGVTQYSGQAAAVPFDSSIDPSKGVAGAAAMGAVVGGGLGAGMAAVHKPLPDVGPLSRAANAGAAVAMPPQEPVPITMLPEQEQALRDQANLRMAGLGEKAKGGKGEDGAKVLPQFLTPQEQDEQGFLKQFGGDAQALARRYGVPQLGSLPLQFEEVAKPAEELTTELGAAPTNPRGIDFAPEVNAPDWSAEAGAAHAPWQNYGDGEPRQTASDPLGELQRQVRDGTGYTTPEAVGGVRKSIEDAWLHANVAPSAPEAPTAPDAPVAPEAPTAAGLEIDPTPDVDSKVRERRILDGLQGIIDQSPMSAVQALGRLNTALQRIGDQPLSAEERARVVRMLNSTAGFKGLSERAPLPVAPSPTADVSADNAVMESLIPERKPKPPTPEEGADILNSQGKPFTTLVGARTAQRKAGDAFEVVPVQGGHVVRRKAAMPDATTETPAEEQTAQPDGPLDGDILNRLGKPFTSIPGARDAARKAGPGYEVKTVNGGLVVRKKAVNEITPEPPAVADGPGAALDPDAAGGAGTGRADDGQPGLRAAEATAAPVESSGTTGVLPDGSGGTAAVAGAKIDDEWTAFAPESGTRQIPRASMPQIQSVHRGAMTNFLNARGIEHEQDEVSASSLKPTQAEFSPEKVAKARDYSGDTDRSILVSADGHVLDGHHQWMAKLEDGQPVKVIRLKAPIDQLLKEVAEFPSARQADGATESAPSGNVATSEAEVQAAPAKPAEPAVAEPPHPNAITRARQARQQPEASAPAAPQGREVSRFNGIYKKGMSVHAARAKAAELNRANTDSSIVYAAEEHSDESLENPYSVVGRKVKGPKHPNVRTRNVEAREAAGEQGGDVAFSRALRGGESLALQELAQADELFALPKSSKDTVEGITGDNDKTIQVKKLTNIPGRTQYNFTTQDGSTARMIVRPANPYGESLYGYDLDENGEMTGEAIGRPGENPDDVPPTDDVWIDVSLLEPGSRAGAIIYNIAATYAHNTGRIFVGDPAGLSNEALRRRTEQMISSALKFGTTAHLAPHPRQVAGDSKLGVPPLRWVYGDHDGNIERMVDVSLKALDNAFPTAKLIEYNPDDNTFFRADTGHVFSSRKELADVVGRALREGEDRGDGRPGQAGWRTVARNALFRNLRASAFLESGAADGGGLLERMRLQRPGLEAGGYPEGASPEEVRKGSIFYQRGPEGSVADPEASVERVESIAKQIAAKWANAPEVVVVSSMQDERVPARAREQDAEQRSLGATGSIEGFIVGKNRIFLVADQLRSDKDVLRVLMHEALGHVGLRGVFGPQFGSHLDRMATLNAARVREKAKQYGLDFDVPGERRMAAEEVLAEMAQTSPELGWVRGAVAMVRSWARRNIPGFTDMKFSDDELIRNFLLPARKFVQAGAPKSKPVAGTTGGDVATDVAFSRSMAGPEDGAYGELTPDQEAALRAVASFKKTPTIHERAEAFKANLGLKITQGLVDQFRPIKDVSQEAYMMARLSKGSDGTMEAALLYGKPFLRNGVPDVDINDGGFSKVLAGLKGEHDRFLMWVAAQRAERLKTEGKENLFTDQDISTLKTLNEGKMPDGTSRSAVYREAALKLNEFNDSVLKVAEESGLIDAEARQLFKDQPYVPFYRAMEEGDFNGPRFSSGLVGQKAFKKLKGGQSQLNADLLENMLLNWSHLYSASARNRAALSAMDAAERLTVAYRVDEGTKDAIKVMREGVTEHWAVEDPYLMEAITALNYAPSPLMKPLAKAKQLLTWGVTVNPTFKIRNLIRDSLSAISQGDLSFNPLENVAKGWKATAKDSQTYASMLAGGGVIKFGAGESSDRVRRDIEKLGGKVLDKDGVNTLLAKMNTLYDAYNEIGDRAENVNRAALFERLIAKGHSHAEANFMARDLMDFSMGGRWPAVRFLAQTVPFLNARLQGLYKLGRAAQEDPRRFGTMALAVSVASLALMAAYSDDDDWKKREDWDRDSYWWFKVGDTAFRIPKPFELGAVGTVAERTAELMMDDEMTGARFRERLAHMAFSTFSMDPVPQAFKPLMDIYANKDSFTKRAIETMGDERLRPQDRIGERTSEIARLLGGWGLPEPLTLLKGEYRALSPKQVDYLMRGYFSWISTAATTVTDMAARPLMDRGERPALRLKDAFLLGNFVETLPTGSSRYVTAMYDQAQDIEQAHASYRDALQRGDTEKAKEILQEDGALLRARPAVMRAKKLMTDINAQARRVEAAKWMSAAEKRERLEQLELRRDQTARRVAHLFNAP